MAIRTYDTTPQQALAAAIHGTILGPNAIRVGDHLVFTSPTGVVRVDRTAIGRWNDDTAVLAAAYERAVA